MTKSDTSFEDWFDTLKSQVHERSGTPFRDADAVRDDYESGRSAYDVADDIVAEYGEAKLP